MCGITGIATSKYNAVNIRQQGHRMLNTLQHRGPDDEGLWLNYEKGLLLAHRRLSIHDLSKAGSQPMLSKSKRYCVVFNGEIYNYLELQSELILNGFNFSSTSDTEVLLAAVEHWGITSAVKKFIGMFAFALYDQQSNTLHLCRDRLGEKPLYYGVIDNEFYFSSELRAIQAIDDSSSLTISTHGLSHYLKYGYISSPDSIYNEVKKLPPASCLTLSLDDVSKRKFNYKIETYWSLLETAEFGLNNQFENFNDATELLDGSLRRTIRRQLFADVNVGLFLSGGIDSTTVAAIAQDISSNKIKTFTIGYTEKEFDESKFAEKTADHIGTDHTTLRLSAYDAKNVIPFLHKIYDEPFADSSQIPAYLVSKLAKKHVTVCLSGDGGDELFAGYNRYLVTNRIWRNINRLPYSIRNTISIVAETIPSQHFARLVSACYSNKQGTVQSKLQKIIGLLKCHDVLSAYDYLSSYWHNPSSILIDKSTYDYQLQLPDTPDFIDQAMYIDQMRYLEGDNLTKTDRASMSVSLETRLPLLSHDIIELAWRIPLEMKIHSNTSKWILRNVLRKYVPENLTNRSKMGFSVPIAQWLREDLRDWAQDVLSLLDNQDILKVDPIKRVWKEHLSNKADHSNKIWTILMFLTWFNSQKS